MTDTTTSAFDDQLLLGIDAGGSGIRVAVFDVRGDLVGKGKASCAPYFNEDGTAYYSIPAVQQAVVDALAEMFGEGIDPSRIAGISSSLNNCMIGGYDRNGDPVMDYMFFLDRRMTSHIQATYEAFEAAGMSRQEYLRRSYVQPLLISAMTAIRENEPELYAKVDQWACSVQPFIYGLLGGRKDADPEDTLGFTGLWDAFTHRFDPEISAITGFGDHNWVPRLVPAAPCGAVSAAGAARTGLVEGTPIFAGTGDRIAEIIAQGAIGEDDITVGMGTSAVISRLSKQPAGYHPAIHVMGGGDHETIRVAFGMGLFGRAFTWARDALSYGTLDPEQLAQLDRDGGGFAAMTERAAASPAGAHGVSFLPHFMGLPDNDQARASFIGITPATTSADIIRAVMEGLAFEVRLGIEAIQDATGGPVTRAFATGGPTRSRMWTQIIADIIGIPVVTTENAAEMAGCKGAAMLAGIGAGLYRDIPDAVAQAVREPEVFAPAPAQVEFYEAAFRRYQRIGNALSENIYV